MKTWASLMTILAVLLTAGLTYADKFIGVGNPEAPKGGEIYRAFGSEPPSLHPIKATDLNSEILHKLTFDQLLRRNPETNEWQPALAKKYEVSKDGMTFTFHLREGVKYTNGEEVTAHDIKFCLDAIRDPKFGAAHMIPYYENIKSAKVIDDHTIRFESKNTYFKNLTALAELRAIPKSVYKDPDNSKLNKTIVASGPYKIKEYKKGRYITLARNKNWWGTKTDLYKSAHNFDEMTFRFVKEENVRLEMLKKGKLDFLGLSPEHYKRKTNGPLFQSKIKKQKVQNKGAKGYGFVAWNLQKKMFQGRKVRVALAHLMNREKMNQRFRYGMSLLATGPWYRQSPYAPKDVDPLRFDRKKAFQLLREAGWEDTDKDGVLDKTIDGKKTPFEFTLLYPNRDYEKYFTLYKQDLKKAGIKANLKVVEWNSFIKALDEKKFDAVALAWGGADVANDPKQIWHSDSSGKGGSNFISYSNQEVDKLIEKGRMTMDKEKRKEIYKKIYKKIAHDAPYAWMFVSKYSLFAHSKDIQYEKPTYTFSVGIKYWWQTQ